MNIISFGNKFSLGGESSKKYLKEEKIISAKKESSSSNPVYMGKMLNQNLQESDGGELTGLIAQKINKNLAKIGESSRFVKSIKFFKPGSFELVLGSKNKDTDAMTKPIIVDLSADSEKINAQKGYLRIAYFVGHLVAEKFDVPPTKLYDEPYTGVAGQGNLQEMAEGTGTNPEWYKLYGVLTRMAAPNVSRLLQIAKNAKHGADFEREIRKMAGVE